MNTTSIGDLANSLLLRTRSTEIKQSISTLTQELSTGKVSDISGRLDGDFAYLADIERNMARLDAYSVAASEARMFSDSAQTGLGRVQDLSAALGNDLLASTPSNLETAISHISERSRQDLGVAITALNTDVAGRSLFGGTESSRAPLAPAADLLTGLETAVSGLTTAVDIYSAAEAWFDDPAGFRAAIYAGSDTSFAPVRIGPGEEASMPLRADDPAVVAVLRDIALSALAANPSLGLDLDTQNELLRRTGEGLLTSQQSLAGIRADLGFTQARIEEATARNGAAANSLEIARNTLLEADPYETAIRLEDAQFQLESLYSATVRTSRLSLVNFLS